MPDLVSYIRGLGKLPPVSAEPDSPVGNPSTTESEGWTITSQNMQGVTVFDKIVMFGDDPAVVWPGSIVQGAHILDQSPADVPLTRAPLTLTLDGLSGTGNGSHSVAVHTPSQATVTDAIDYLLPKSGTSVADFDVYINQAYSVNEACAKLGINVHFVAGQVQAELSKSFSEKKASFAVNVTQKYYTVSASSPGPTRPYIDPTVPIADAAHYMGAGNPPLYIETVDYGRRLVLFMMTDKKQQDFSASMNATYNWASGSAHGDVSVTQSDLLSESTIHLLDIGGSTTAVTKILTANPGDTAAVSSIAEYIANGASWTPESPGAAVGWNYKYLSDNTSVLTSDVLNYNQLSFQRVCAHLATEKRFDNSGDTQDEHTDWYVKPPEEGTKIDVNSVQHKWVRDPTRDGDSKIESTEATPDYVHLKIYTQAANLKMFGHKSGAGTAYVEFDYCGA